MTKEYSPGAQPAAEKKSWKNFLKILTLRFIQVSILSYLGIRVVGENYDILLVNIQACPPGERGESCGPLSHAYLMITREVAGDSDVDTYVGEYSGTVWPVVLAEKKDEFGNPIKGDLTVGLIGGDKTLTIPGEPGTSENPVGTPDREYELVHSSLRTVPWLGEGFKIAEVIFEEQTSQP